MRAWIALVALLPKLACAQGLVLGGTTGTAPPSPAAPGEGCMSVTAGSAVSYGCINEQEKALVAQQKAGVQAAGVDENAAPPRLGLYNQAATREHLGSSFGHSVIPQSVPPPNYASPLVPPR